MTVTRMSCSSPALPALFPRLGLPRVVCEAVTVVSVSVVAGCLAAGGRVKLAQELIQVLVSGTTPPGYNKLNMTGGDY